MPCTFLTWRIKLPLINTGEHWIGIIQPFVEDREARSLTAVPFGNESYMLQSPGGVIELRSSFIYLEWVAVEGCGLPAAAGSEVLSISLAQHRN